MCKMVFMETYELKKRMSFNLKRLRKIKHLSQFELAEKANISEQTMASIEGCRMWPSDKTLASIVTALGADVHSLFLPADELDDAERTFSENLKNAVVNSVKALVEDTLQKI